MGILESLLTDLELLDAASAIPVEEGARKERKSMEQGAPGFLFWGVLQGGDAET